MAQQNRHVECKKPIPDYYETSAMTLNNQLLSGNVTANSEICIDKRSLW